jgi:hypothetical protein
MTGSIPRVPRRDMPVPEAALSLIAVAFSELRRDVSLLLESAWAEPVRRRAEELATTLADACDRRGLSDACLAARSLANLARLRAEQVRPIQSALSQKLDELLRSAQRHLDLASKRQLG